MHQREAIAGSYTPLTVLHTFPPRLLTRHTRRALLRLHTLLEVCMMLNSQRNTNVKRLDPTLRFSDVVPVWEQILRDKGGVLETDSDNETIALIYRLNQYRKIVREQSDKGWTDYDRYVVRRGRLCVHIEPRMNINLIARMTRLDGSPITPREIKPNPLDNNAKRFVEADEEELSPEAKRIQEEMKNLKPRADALRIKP
jgi:hypothetical protein